MADLDDLKAAQPVKIMGQDLTALETFPVNATPQGGLHVNLRDASGNEEGTLANPLVVAEVSNGSGAQADLTVGVTAVLANSSGTNLSNRKMISVFNNSQNTIYWGYTSGVTLVTGTPLFRNQERGWAIGPNMNIYLIAFQAGNDVRVTERS